MKNIRKLILLITSIVIVSSSFASTAVWTKKYFNRNLPTDYNLTNTVVTWMDLPAASTSAVLATTSISTATLVASGTSYTLAAGDITDVVFPRNLTVDVAFSGGEATTTVNGSLLITGNNQFGRSTTETISISTNAAAGVVAWSTITSLAFSGVTISSASADAMLSVGSGVKMALPNNIEGSGDMIKVIEAGSTTTTYTANTVYDTIDFVTDPDGSNDYYIYFMDRTNKTKYKYKRD